MFSWVSVDDFEIHKRVHWLVWCYTIIDVESQNWSDMKLILVHMGTVILSAKRCFSQAETITPRCARIYKVELLEQAWWFSWWCADNSRPHRIRCSIPSHYIYQGMTSSSSLSAQAALQVAAVCNVASRGCREKVCHSDVFWQNGQAGYEETTGWGRHRCPWTWLHACLPSCTFCNHTRYVRLQHRVFWNSWTSQANKFERVIATR